MFDSRSVINVFSLHSFAISVNGFGFNAIHVWFIRDTFSKDILELFQFLITFIFALA